MLRGALVVIVILVVVMSSLVMTGAPTMMMVSLLSVLLTFFIVKTLSMVIRVVAGAVLVHVFLFVPFPIPRFVGVVSVAILLALVWRAVSVAAIEQCIRDAATESVPEPFALGGELVRIHAFVKILDQVTVQLVVGVLHTCTIKHMPKYSAVASPVMSVVFPVFFFHWSFSAL